MSVPEHGKSGRARVQFTLFGPNDLKITGTRCPYLHDLSRTCSQTVCDNSLSQKTDQERLDDALSNYKVLCEKGNFEKCFELAALESSEGQFEQAKARRIKTCETDLQKCKKLVLENQWHSLYEIFDLTPVLCFNSHKESDLLKIACKLSELEPKNKSIEQKWMDLIKKKFINNENDISKLRNDYKNKNPEFDFTTNEAWHFRKTNYYLEHKTIPFKIRFPIKNTKLLPQPMKAKDTNIFFTHAFSSGSFSEQSSFQGYLVLDPDQFLEYGKKMEVRGGSLRTINVSGIVIGFISTGVVPAPIIILDK